MTYQESSLEISYNASLPITVSEMKTHLRVTGSSEDTLIETYTRAACRHVENLCRICLLPATVTQYFTRLPGITGVPVMLENGATVYYPFDYFSLGIGNATTVTTVSANTTDAPTTFTNMTTTTVLLTGFNRPRIYAPDGWTFGTISPYQIRIIYAAGYADTSSIPADIKTAAMLVCADMYENRMDSVKQLPTAAEILLQNYMTMQGV